MNVDIIVSKNRKDAIYYKDSCHSASGKVTYDSPYIARAKNR